MLRHQRVHTTTHPTPLLDRLEHMLDKSDATDRSKSRGIEYAIENGNKRIYAKKKWGPAKSSPQGQAPSMLQLKLYARWDGSTQNPARTKDRKALGTARCGDFLRQVGEELRAAKGDTQAAPALQKLDALVSAHVHYAPTTAELRWLAQQLRACHQGVEPTPPANTDAREPKPQRRRFVSLDQLPSVKPDAPAKGAQSNRGHRGSWRSSKHQ